MTKSLSEDTSRSYDYVVGIGASAGGLEALQKLLTALPSDTGLPFIIVQHLSPDYKSLLSEILSKYTNMPVIQVEDGMEIKGNCVYIIQPGKNMRLSHGKLLLSSQKEHELNLPIDLFFRSLAEEAGSKAIAIILSGTGSDGSNGIKAIKENDGLILVQDIETAKFDGMPRSAIRTGIVDAQLSPDKIAMELMHIANASPRDLPSEKSVRKIDEDLLKKVYIILKKVCNINFTHYKQTTVIRRIERRMMLTHKETLPEYVEYLYEDIDEVKTLSKEILIGVTSFFRDPEFFQCLKDKAINDILLHGSKDESIRVWVAGCSTGEEAYSIAMLFCEAMETLKIKRSVKIFATDLDMESISTAGKGIYGDGIIEAVSPVRLSRFFTRQNNTYVVNRDLRKMIVFSPHNVFQDPPFGKLDLISCRNMLIYFQPVLQNDLFSIFHSSLKDGGYLFLGKSEAIGAFTEAFPVADAVAKIFSHRSDVRISGTKAVPFLQTTYFDDEFYDDVNDRVSRKIAPVDSVDIDEDNIDTSLLEQFMPACIILNEKNEIVHTYGESSNYIHFSIGKFSNALFDIVTEGLKVPVSTILKEAREKQGKVQYKNLCFEGEREKTTINLTAMPIDRRSTDKSVMYAVIFSEQRQRGESDDAIPYEIDRIASQRITDLEQELGEVQRKLDRSIAEQECVNEELQAANEELLTANEELQSSNEELQSVNEELYTVNSEYQQKLTELADLNDDIANFLASTMIGIIFVDNKLNIRRYTDYVTTEFSVMDHDIGRSLKFISYHFPTVDISEICDNVLKTLLPDEREITTSKKKVFFMRVAPYRSIENKILGCVITLVDITTQKLGLAKLQNTEERLSLLQQANEARNDYLSRIVHEIRTPMGELSKLSKAATDNIGDNVGLRNDIEKISSTVNYMASIVADIAEAAQNERLAISQSNEPFSIREVLSGVDEVIRQRAKNAGQAFEISVDDTFNPIYEGNKNAVEQILINYLSGLIMHTRTGGEITLSVFEQKNGDTKSSVCFVVSDTGIDEDNVFLSDMFKPYTRVQGGDKNETTSLGLGLSIAYNLVKSMDGNVSVSSETNNKTTFSVVIKLKRCNGKKIQPNMLLESGEQEYDLRGTNVMVVEDNEINRLILGALLSKANVTYTEATDGDIAVKIFTESPANTFDCILMDMRMPRVDGIRATMMIRDSGKEDAATVPIIGVSANGFADDIKQAFKAGLNDYTFKPIDRDKLFALIMKYKPVRD